MPWGTWLQIMTKQTLLPSCAVEMSVLGLMCIRNTGADDLLILPSTKKISRTFNNHGQLSEWIGCRSCSKQSPQPDLLLVKIRERPAPGQHCKHPWISSGGNSRLASLSLSHIWIRRHQSRRGCEDTTLQLAVTSKVPYYFKNIACANTLSGRIASNAIITES